MVVVVRVGLLYHSLLLLMPPFPRLDGAWGPWGPNHVLVARTGSRRRIIGVGRIASTTAVGCYVVRGFNPGPTLTRPPSYYTPTGTRDGEGDDHTGGGVSGSVC